MTELDVMREVGRAIGREIASPGTAVICEMSECASGTLMIGARSQDGAMERFELSVKKVLPTMQKESACGCRAKTNAPATHEASGEAEGPAAS